MVLLNGKATVADQGAARGGGSLFFCCFFLFLRLFRSWFLHNGGWALGRGRHRRTKYPPVEKNQQQEHCSFPAMNQSHIYSLAEITKKTTKTWHLLAPKPSWLFGSNWLFLCYPGFIPEVSLNLWQVGENVKHFPG
ncbi:MAG: hypothetical protein ACLQUS_15345 [Desulfobaccales bacterium]